MLMRNIKLISNGKKYKSILLAAKLGFKLGNHSHVFMLLAHCQKPKQRCKAGQERHMHK